MYITFNNLYYRYYSGDDNAYKEIQLRLKNKIELPFKTLDGSKMIYCPSKDFSVKISQILSNIDKLPSERLYTKETILLDSYYSATIEGAKTTVDSVVKAIRTNKYTKSDKMVANVARCYAQFMGVESLTHTKIVELWQILVKDVCDSQDSCGDLYRSSMVYVGNATRIVHTPPSPDKVKEYMSFLLKYINTVDIDFITASIAHFYFVYVHPFCDGNGRFARLLNTVLLKKRGYKVPLISDAISQNLQGYYKSIYESEQVFVNDDKMYMDVTPFISYILDTLLSYTSIQSVHLSKDELLLLWAMRKHGKGAEITVKKAVIVLKKTEEKSRIILNNLVDKGLLGKYKNGNKNIYFLKNY